MFCIQDFKIGSRQMIFNLLTKHKDAIVLLKVDRQSTYEGHSSSNLGVIVFTRFEDLEI